MSQDIVSGLFGLSPYQVQQQRNASLDDFASKQAQRTLGQQATYGLSMGGGQLARGGAGMLGMVDPAVEEAKQRQAVMASGGDLSTPEGLRAKAAQFAQAGDQQTAMRLVIAAKAAEKDAQEAALKAAQVEREASTTELNYQRAITEMTKEKREKFSAYGQQLIDAGYVPGTDAFKKKMEEYLKATVTEKTKPTGTTITLPGQKNAIDIPKFEGEVQGTIKPHLQTVQAADLATATLKDSMKTGNFASFNASKQQLARAFSDGTISRAEVIAAGADPMLVGRLADATSEIFTGTPTLDTQQKMLRTLEIAKQVAAGKGKIALNRMRNVGTMSGLEKNQLDTLLTFPEFDVDTKSPPKPSGTSASDDALIAKHLKPKKPQ